MKSENLLLNFIRAALNVAWFANNIIAFLGLVALIILFFAPDHMNVSVESRLDPAVDVSFLANSNVSDPAQWTNGVRQINIQADHALIKFQVKNNVLTNLCFDFFCITMELLVITIIYNLRKVFGTIKENEPFRQENIRRLKIIALCFILITPWIILLRIVAHQFLLAHISGYHQQLQIMWQESLSGLWIGIAIYVTTYVFKSGLELKKENAQFI